MSKMDVLSECGQSVWLDYIDRAFLKSSEFAHLIAEGLSGLTSNPSILQRAIKASTLYDREIERLDLLGKSPEQIYDVLAMEDIAYAADMFRPLYEQTDARDGYVSLEVSPKLAHDTNRTIASARRLFDSLKRPNVMIKIPATNDGYPAITEAVWAGINVNVTLIFSLNQYQDAVEAYVAGLEKRLRAGKPLNRVASVASVFISRIDTAIDTALAKIGRIDLEGTIAIANATLIYEWFQTLLRSERWKKLADAGAQPQRPVWASTGTKNPAYADTMYVDNLVGPNTVNTMPLTTLRAFMDHGKVEPSLGEDVSACRARMTALAHLGIDFDSIAGELLDDGVEAFVDSFTNLLQCIEFRRNTLVHIL